MHWRGFAGDLVPEAPTTLDRELVTCEGCSSALERKSFGSSLGDCCARCGHELEAHSMANGCAGYGCQCRRFTMVRDPI